MENLNIILKKIWGFDQFRPLQQEIIQSVLEGKDTLAILPTGGGKSLCFQIPCLAKEGICLVISPLTALMKDQVANLKKKGIPALAIHAGMERNNVIRTLKNAAGDYFKFLYVSPERLETSLFKEFMPAFNLNLIAVDEAHCISQWGYDFRPSYLKIPELRNQLLHVPVIALTASATPVVQNDICRQLDFSSHNIFRQSYERKNLSYSVFMQESKLDKVLDIVNKVPGPGIIYCKSRKRTLAFANFLNSRGVSAQNYHAGLSAAERSQRQEDWINNKINVIVSTNAFGMGIDKPDVKKVIHVDAPDCLESYYQEAGRAGRDGSKAYAVLLSCPKEVEQLLLMDMIRFPSFPAIKDIYRALINYLQIPVNEGENKSYIFHLESFTNNFKLKNVEVINALKALEQDGWISHNEKKFMPSTLVFTTNKTDLYAFEKMQPQFEPLLNLLLRTYEGIFDFSCFISEGLLAKTLGKEEVIIADELNKLTEYGLIRYTQKNEVAQISFKKNRVGAEDLSFDIVEHNKRKAAFRERVEKMCAYISGVECRSRFMSIYFGDIYAKPCGICDNCLASKKQL
ncbi:MAG: RecQ family ATP-dependent DNA helicase [Flavisolibacter sp.]